MSEHKKGDIWHRYEEFEDRPEHILFYVERVTPNGLWIRRSDISQVKNFIYLNRALKWAFPTEKEALDDFIKKHLHTLSLQENRMYRLKQLINIARERLHEIV